MWKKLKRNPHFNVLGNLQKFKQSGVSHSPLLLLIYSFSKLNFSVMFDCWHDRSPQQEITD